MSGVTESLVAVWGSSASSAWAVGLDGTVLRWDGSAWSVPPADQRPATTEGLLAVWGSSASDVLIAGKRGTLFRWNGTSWLRQDPGTTESLYGIWGTSASDVWVSGGSGAVLRWEQAYVRGGSSIIPLHVQSRTAPVLSGGRMRRGGSPRQVPMRRSAA